MRKADTKRQETSRTVFLLIVVALAGCGLPQSKKYLDKLIIKGKKEKIIQDFIQAKIFSSYY